VFATNYFDNYLETSLPKVIWEEGRVVVLSHTYTVKSPLVTMAHPKFTPENTPSCGPIPKPHYNAPDRPTHARTYACRLHMYVRTNRSFT